MQKKIIFLIFILFCICMVYWVMNKKSFNKEPLEIEVKQLRAELSNTQVDGNKICRWEYGYTKNYHLFYLACVPSNKNDQSSFFTIEKKYKIKRNKLKVKKMRIIFGKAIKIKSVEEGGSVATPVKAIEIKWD